MKLRYIFTAIVSSLCLLVACQQEDPSSLGTIQLEKTFLTIPLEGGSVDLNLVASAPWAFAKSVLINKDPETYAELPAWLTASALSGETGAAKITFTAAANGFGREQELQINTGSQIQYIIVRQGSMEAEKASCAEVIAGADGKTYTVTGTCTSIANTTYGNWYLNDGKDEIYIVREYYEEYVVGQGIDSDGENEVHVMNLSEALALNLKKLGFIDRDLTLLEWLRESDYRYVNYQRNWDKAHHG